MGQGLSFESRRWTSDTESPAISMTFRGEVFPATIRALCFGNPSASATTLSTAALALPRSAGALTRTLSVSPSQPAMPSREDPGTTLIGSLMGRPRSPREAAAR